MSGPFTRTVQRLSLPNESGYRAVMYRKTQTWYTQKKPYLAPLPYTCDITEMMSDTEFPSNGISDVPGYQADDNTGGMQTAYNAAYSKFVGNLGEQSQWSVNLIERSQSVEMIEKRALQIFRFARSLRKLDFHGAARELGLSKPPRKVRRSKRFADNFLEYHFGWEPLVKDIGGAIDLLQKPYPLGKVFGKGYGRREYPDIFTSGGVRYFDRVNYDSGVLIAAHIRISNPNLFLANQLGFANPLSVAWELVPFSFVVDWFVNVGQILGSFTDFAGVTIENASVSRFQKTSKLRRYSAPWGYFRQSLATGIFVRRTIGSIPGPSLTIKPFEGFSVIRGTTAIALLLQQLR